MATSHNGYILPLVSRAVGFWIPLHLSRRVWLCIWHPFGFPLETWWDTMGTKWRATSQGLWLPLRSCPGADNQKKPFFQSHHLHRYIWWGYRREPSLLLLPDFGTPSHRSPGWPHLCSPSSSSSMLEYNILCGCKKQVGKEMLQWSSLEISHSMLVPKSPGMHLH